MRKWAIVCAAFCMSHSIVFGQPKQTTSAAGPEAKFSHILGRPTDNAVTVSVLSETKADVFIEYGVRAGSFSSKSITKSLEAGVPAEFELSGLAPATSYVYRVQAKTAGAKEFSARDLANFRTQRRSGESFVFGVQGDSHPERLGKMYHPDLYVQTMTNVAKDGPDFYFLMGDDFSIERLIERNTLSQAAVDSIYAHQRSFLSLVGKSTPLMLVNGNHEQAAKYLLDGTANNFAVFAGKARTKFFPLPAPESIYSGNTKPVEHIGLLRDYYAWQWGDALFVVIDPYWHSDVAVDNEAGTKAPQRDAGRGAAQPDANNREAKRRAKGDEAENNDGANEPAGKRQGKGNRDLWQITLGDEQYAWLRSTLQQSHAKFKFVFSHHVSGTGRGGVEVAGLYEWGGEDRRGVDRFLQMRPKWEKPIHDLMRDAGVTIFFQGHDHLYARQELEGVVYQSCPNPADPTFTAFNREAYRSGDVFPNSGHLRVTVMGGPDATCKVEYIRSSRPSDEAEHGKNGSVVHSYEVKPRAPVSVENRGAK